MIFFDLETTGVDSAKDRAVSLAYQIVSDATGAVLEEYSTLLNPGMPIPESASAVHGITDEMVADAPTFKEIAKKMAIKFTGRKIAGYNIVKFDIPVLVREFALAGINWRPSHDNVFDVLHALRKAYPMDLSSVYKRCFGKDLENAHDAMADVKATAQVAGVYLNRIDGFEAMGIPEGVYDWGGKFKINSDGKVEFTFGKYRGEQVTGSTEHLGFLEWMMERDFHPDTLAKTRKMINVFRERMARAAGK